MNGHTTARGSIVGVVASVPARIFTNADCPDPAAAWEAAKMTGVQERRRVTLFGEETAGSLCEAAAVRLLEQLDWPSDTVDLLVYVTQTPTSAVPADAFAIAARLGLPERCMVLQVNWSCSGYVYGLLTAMRLLDEGKRALLLVGDVTSTILDPADRATAPLFGDAGSATAIVGSTLQQHFVVGSDGSGAEKLCCDLHGSMTICDDIKGPHLHMDGAAVFNFTLRVVPKLVADVLTYGRPDYLLFHQANRFMLEHLAKKSKLAEAFKPEQIPTNIARFGNCSCASIPLLMCSELGQQLREPGNRQLAMFGFGAGWAWAGASINSHAMVAELLEVE